MKKLFLAILLLITGICTGQIWLMPDYIFSFEKAIEARDGINLMELPVNGSNYIGFDGPDSRTTSVRLQLPDTDPVFGQILQFSTPVAGISTGLWIDGVGNDANVIAVLGATTVALPANTYSNGTLGVGATLTGNANGAFPVTDGITFVVNDRILVKNEASQLKNGLFVFTQVGTAGTPYILTRATDGDVQAEIDDETIIVQAGTANRGKLFAQQTVLPVVGTDNIVFASISSPYVTQKGAGIQVTGQISYWDNAARQLNKGSSNLTYTAATLTLFASNIAIPTTTSTVGTIYKNGERVIHFYKSAGTNDNIFIGKNSGNYTAVATSNFNGNIGIGDRVLDALTSGYFNTIVGTAAGDFMTTGFSNSLYGTQSGRNISTGDRNTGMGDAALYGAAINIDINGNSAYGALSLNLINTGADNNAAFGLEAGEGVSTGDNNSYFGTRAGEGNTTFSGQVVVGYDIDAAAADFAVNIANLLGGSTATGIPRWLGFASLVTDNTNTKVSSVDPVTGDVELMDISSFTPGTLYSGDGSLAGNRAVGIGDFYLRFDATDGNYMLLDPASFMSVLKATDGTANSFLQLTSDISASVNANLIAQNGTGSSTIGIYSSAADGYHFDIATTDGVNTLGFTGNAVTRSYQFDGANVGIGITPTADQLFRISDSGNDYLIIDKTAETITADAVDGFFVGFAGQNTLYSKRTDFSFGAGDIDGVGDGNRFIINPSINSAFLDNSADDIKLGINTVAPEYRLHAYSSGTAAIANQVSATSSKIPVFLGINTRGDLTTPTATQSGDILAQFSGMGHDGLSYSNNTVAAIKMFAASTFDPSNHPTEIGFYTTNVSTTTQQMLIDKNGGITITALGGNGPQVVTVGNTGKLAVGTNGTERLNAPYSAVYIMDDFLNVSTIETGEIGTAGWTSTGSGTGAGIAGSTSPTAHPGTVSMQTGTTTTGNAAISLGSFYSAGGGVTTYTTDCRVSTLSTVGEEYIARIGLHDATSGGAVTDGIYFQYDRLTDGNFWSVITSNNSTPTKIVTSTAIVGNTWYRLKIVVNADGTEARFYVDDVEVSGTGYPITTNIPTAAARTSGPSCQMVKSAGTTSVQLDVDFAEFKQILTVTR